METLDLKIFDLSPIPMWLQDFSGVRKIFNRWKENGIENLEAYLLEDSSRLQECLATIHTLHVNQSTLNLYEAEDLNEILENFLNFLTPEITAYQVKFFLALWNNKTEYTIPVVNYTCKGKQIDIQLRANIMTGYENSWELLLLTTENISDYQNARRFAESIFLHSPTALWVKDYSEIKKRFDQIHQLEISNLDQYIHENSNFIMECFNSIVSVNVNQALLSLFKATNKCHLDHHFKNLCHNQLDNFYFQLLDLWDAYQQQQHDFKYESECEYKALDDSSLFLLEQLNIFPDAKDNWDTIQVAYTDFTERKLLEDHLQYMSQYDQLTQLHNRTFFNEEIKRLKNQNITEISCIYMDINGLKEINDHFGHHQGDLLLKHFAEVLIQVTQDKNYSISRIGGDEFVILMPNCNEVIAQTLIQDIQNKIIEFKSEEQYTHISFSSGYASINKPQEIECLVKNADHKMYDQKRHHYQNSPL